MDTAATASAPPILPPKPDTLGFHRDMAVALLGHDSPAVIFMDEQIYKAAKGRDEIVVTPESQLIGMLITMHVRDQAYIAEVKARNVTAELY
jgi:hypothetical protein